MIRGRFPAALLLLASAHASAQAEATVAPISWLCWVQPRELNVIYCGEAGEPGALPSAPPRDDPLPSQYGADLFADSQRRNITRLVRTAPDLYANRIWRIPVISPIVDVQRGHELVRSTMCGRENACTVELALPP